MKITMKKLLALILAVLMLVPMGMIPSFALEADESVTANWSTLAAKYSKGTWKIIAPKGNNYQIKTDGFTFDESADGGIKVTTPDYATFNGTYGVSAVSSKVATPLDGLSVVISADKFDSMLDNVDCGNTIGVLWTEEKIDSIAQFNDASKSYDKGIYTAVAAYGTGLRTLIPTVEGATPLTPSFDPAAPPNGQALYISVTCDIEQPDAAPVASSVKIAYYDGYYINGDGNPGYRWSFRARNNRNTGNSDATRLSQNWEAIDLSDGLAVSVRADEEHGFIVTVNGYDYYKAEDICYYPDANTDWYGYNLNNLTDDKIEESDPVYLNTMTYAKKDIDLTRLTAAGEGYVTVGAISNNDSNLTGHGCDYTVDYINGVPAASWQGESLSAEHICEMTDLGTKAPTCVRSGADASMCKVCGKYAFENITEPTGHTPEPLKELEKAACDNYGTMASFCSVCQSMVEGYAIPKTPHQFSAEWTGDFTCETGGTRSNTCDLCSALVTETLEAGHVYEWITVTEASCIAGGTEKQVCTVCGAEGETRETEIDPDVHVSDIWKPIVADGAWAGLERALCTECGNSAERTVDVYEYIKHFTDIKKGQWYEDEVAYCVQLGYVSGMTETTFVPNGKLTRAQFLTLLAALDGVDLETYKGKDAGFTDVKASHWYNEEVCWAVENGITSGISETKFGPNNNVTRAQVARFFYVYTEKTGGNVEGRADISAYPDAAKVQAWAEEPVKWAVDAGLISGVAKNGVDYLDPNGNATRAQAARMFMLYTQLGECDHLWSEWGILNEPTLTDHGLKMRICAHCLEKELLEYYDPVRYYTITFALYEEDIERGAVISGTDQTSVSYEVRYGDFLRDIIGDYPMGFIEGYHFLGWYIEEYNYTLTEAEWTGFCYPLELDCTLYGVFDVGPCFGEFTLVFDVDGDVTTTGDTLLTTYIDIGDIYSDYIFELPVCEEEGKVFKGWWNRERRIAITPENFESDTFDVYIKEPSYIEPLSDYETLDSIDKTIVLVPIWDYEGEKDWTIRFVNYDVEDFEPLEYKMNVGDTYMSVFAGEFPSPGVYELDEWTVFQGWYIEEVNFMLTEGDMWDEGYLALEGDWEFVALYLEV